MNCIKFDNYVPMIVGQTNSEESVKVKKRFDQGLQHLLFHQKMKGIASNKFDLFKFSDNYSEGLLRPKI